MVVRRLTAPDHSAMPTTLATLLAALATHAGAVDVQPTPGTAETRVIRVNQLGYLPAGPKHAVWVSETTEPAEFVVRDHRADIVFGGRTEPTPPEQPGGRPVGARAWRPRHLGPH